MTVDELLATAPAAVGATDEMLVIDPDTRQINLPGVELIFGVESDAQAERKYFYCPRYVGNGLDLASCFIRVNYRNANGVVDAYLVDDMSYTDDAITFSWALHRNVTLYKGQVQFVVCCNRPGSPAAEWNTTVTTGIVLAGLEPDGAAVEAATSDAISGLLARVDAQVANVTAEGKTQVGVVKTTSETAKTAAVAEIEAKGVNVRASIPDDYTALSGAVRAIEKGMAPGIVCEAEGETVVLRDASNRAMQGLRIFGRSTQNGVPTPDTPVEIVSIVNPTITVGEQTVSITRTLPGIPVASGGNYTDSDGQQWISDEVDLERGVYVQRIHQMTLDGSSDESIVPQNIGDSSKIRLLITNSSIATMSNAELGCALCDCAPRAYAGDSGTYAGCQGISVDKSGNVHLFLDVICKMTEAQIREWLSENPVYIMYGLTTPIETPLSETEIAAYRALHTNKPNTTILNDSGAHMAVAYTADTKLYIDNLFKE